MIYLDNAATTKPSKAALDGAHIYLYNYFNPSAQYAESVKIRSELEAIRRELVSYIASPLEYELIFTSCGSEADNTAVFSSGRRGNIITTNGEHSAIYNSFLEQKNRIDVRFASLNEDGGVNEDSLLSLIDDETTFISVVHVNNETGAINDVEKLARLAKVKNNKLIFHSDGVQAYGKLPNYSLEYVDIYSTSAHKIGGLKGVGALIKRKKLHVKPLIYGGGQENGVRSGTENTFGIKVFELAAKERYAKISENYAFVTELKDTFLNHLDKQMKIISSPYASPYILSISALGTRGEIILHAVETEGLIIGTGSACSSKKPHSRVLSACKYNNQVLDGAIRISFSPSNTVEEVKQAAEIINNAYKRFGGVK